MFMWVGVIVTRQSGRIINSVAAAYVKCVLECECCISVWVESSECPYRQCNGLKTIKTNNKKEIQSKLSG